MIFARWSRAETSPCFARQGKQSPNVLHATPQGIDRLASILERYGEDFGPTAVLGHIENARRR